MGLKKKTFTLRSAAPNLLHKFVNAQSVSVHIDRRENMRAVIEWKTVFPMALPLALPYKKGVLNG